MATDFDTARTQYDNYRFCFDNGHSQWLETAKKCFDYWRGKQWDPKDYNKAIRGGRPALTLNVIESLVRAMEGVQCALRNDVRFMPVQNANAESAKIQDSVWLHIQQQNQFEFTETDTYKKGIIMGRAFYEIRVNSDDNYQGHVQIAQRRSQDVILDPSFETYDTEGWPQVFTRRWVSYNDIENLYGKEKAASIGSNSAPDWMDYEDQFMSQQMGALPYYRNGNLTDTNNIRARLLLDRQYYVYKHKDVFIDIQTGDTSEIPETWERNRIAKVLELTPGLSTIKKKVKTVRWEVTCENTTMLSEDSPYKYFTIVPYFPSFIDGVSMGGVEQLLDAQNMYNKVTSQELHIVNTTANSGYKVKKGSLRNMTPEQLEENGAKSGFVAELDNVEDLVKILPNPVPQGHDRISGKADQIMRSLGGVSNSGRGFSRDDAAGSKVMQDQAAQEVNFAGWMNNLHRSKQMVASRVLDCVRTHYTDTRVIMINRGSTFSPQVEEVTINQPSAEGAMLNDVSQGKYSTVLVPSPTRTSLSEEDFKLLVGLRKDLGIAIPDDMLIELSPASNKGQIIQMLKGDSNERQRAAEEAAAQADAAKQALDTARARKEEAAAMLSQARAEKAAVEAASDPDAAYERVENNRIGVDRERLAIDTAIEKERIAMEQDQHDTETALEIRRIESQDEIARLNAKAKENRPSLRRDNKPGKK